MHRGTMNQENRRNASFELKKASLQICSDPEASPKPYFDRKTKDLLFENFNYRILKAVRPYSRYVCLTDVNDLFQEGCLGLVEAIIDFDESQNEPFTKFADRYIYRSLKRFWRQQIDTGRFLAKLISIEAERQHSASNSYPEQVEQYLTVRRSLFLLSPKQRLVIERLYGFEGQPASLSQIALENKISHKAVRRTYKRGLMNLCQDPDLQNLNLAS